MSQHIFEYAPSSQTVYNSEYLCECEKIHKFKLLVLSAGSNLA